MAHRPPLERRLLTAFLALGVPLYWLLAIYRFGATHPGQLTANSLVLWLTNGELPAIICCLMAGVLLWRNGPRAQALSRRLMLYAICLSCLSVLLWLIVQPHPLYEPSQSHGAGGTSAQHLLRAILTASLIGGGFFCLPRVPVARPGEGSVVQDPDEGPVTGPPHDVFLSYCRGSGRDLAQFVYLSLVRRGYKVFMDVRDLGAGHFDQALLHTIEATPDFVAVVTPQPGKQGDGSGQWFVRELEHAIASGRNVIPLVSGPSGPDLDSSLPDDFASHLPLDLVSRHQMVAYSHEHADASIDRLCTMLSKPPRPQRRGFSLILGVGRRNVTFTVGVATLSMLFLLALPRTKAPYERARMQYQRVLRGEEREYIVTPENPMWFEPYKVTDGKCVSATIRDTAGCVVRSLPGCVSIPYRLSRFRYLRWDGKRNDSTWAADGAYILELAVDGRPEYHQPFLYRRSLLPLPPWVEAKVLAAVPSLPAQFYAPLLFRPGICLSAVIQDSSSRAVRRLPGCVSISPHDVGSLQWDGLRDDGYPAPDGEYLLQLRSEGRIYSLPLVLRRFYSRAQPCYLLPQARR